MNRVCVKWGLTGMVVGYTGMMCRWICVTCEDVGPTRMRWN